MHARSLPSTLSRAAVVVALASTFVACAEPLMPVAADVAAPTLSVADEEARTYLVRFNGNGVPRDFEATVAGLGGEVVFAHARAGIGAVRGIDDAGADRIATLNGIAGVDLDAFTHVGPTSLSEPVSVGFDEAEPMSPNAPATAVFYSRQWNMRAIAAPAAWAAGKLGSATTKVGVLDTGIDPTIVDLNGLVDLTLSRAFVALEDTLKKVIPNAPAIADAHYHGTHVAATISSNAVGAAGVGSKTKIVSLKTCRTFKVVEFDSTGKDVSYMDATCPTSAVLQAILYAADVNLDVINMSLGGAFYRRQVSARGGNGPSFVATINRVMNYANQRGVTVVVASGNDGIDLDHSMDLYGAYCSAPHVICVSATGPTNSSLNGPWQNVDAAALYSNFGRSSVNVAAPGGNGSFVYAVCSRYSVAVPVCRTGTYVLGSAGTSMASPHVAGLAALVAAEVGRDPGAIRERIEAFADDLGATGTDPWYGKGRINVARSLGL